MTLLDFHPEAVLELEAAVLWHEQERSGYGLSLYESVRHRILQATRFPQSGVPVRGFDPGYDIRSFLLSKFPYCVIAATVKDRRIVVAVAHTSRNPGYWHERVK